MEMTSKGFVYTLEAVIAATLFIGIVMVVLPEIQPERPSRTVQNTLHDGLKTVDRTSNLEEMNRTEIENELDQFIPAGFQHSVRTTNVKTTTRSVAAPAEVYIDQEGNHSEIQFWISSANSMDATFRGEKIIDSYSSSGYELRNVGESEGWLNFTGTGEASFDFDTYVSSGKLPERENLRTVSYIAGEKEIKVFVWN